jgi:hypothetical protein
MSIVIMPILRATFGPCRLRVAICRVQLVMLSSAILLHQKKLRTTKFY